MPALLLWLMFSVSDENPDQSALCDRLVDTSISTYNTIQNQLLPTPAKSHYTFNLRDLSKVFQGILMAKPSNINVSCWIARTFFKVDCYARKQC